MTAVVSLVQKDIYTALRTFILGLITCEVVDGLDNGVPMPTGPFIAITALYLNRIETNINSYSDPTPTTGTTNTELHAQYAIQIDVYGPLSSDWASIIVTMFRDEYGCDSLAPNVQPLYADDPKQIPIVDGEENYEQRWMITANLQYNPVIQTPMQFFTTATVGIIEVDASYPP